MTLPPPRPRFAAPAGLARRGWLVLLATGASLAAAGLAFWRQRSASTASQSAAELESATLERIVDLLVPRDETPGALDLGLHRQVLGSMAADASLALAYAEMLQVLDREAWARHRGHFLGSDASVQQAMLEQLSQAPPSAPGVRGFILLRQQTMQLYYAQPQAWPSLGFAGPPQPLGFMDYAEPPRPRS